jgi:hypothetical protein
VRALCAAGLSFWLLFYVVPPIMIGADFEITALHFEGARKAFKYEPCSPKYPENIRIPQIAINEEPLSTSRHVSFLIFRKTEQFESEVSFPNGSAAYWHSCEIGSDREWHFALFSVSTYFARNAIAIDKSCSISQIFDIEMNLHDPIGTFECILRQQQFWLIGNQIRPFGIAHNASLLRRGNCGGRSGIGRFLGYPDGLLRMASVDLGGPPQSIGGDPQREGEKRYQTRRDSTPPFGPYLGQQKNALEYDPVFGGAFIIGGIIFFVVLAFGIREIITRSDEDRYLIDRNQKENE